MCGHQHCFQAAVVAVAVAATMLTMANMTSSKTSQKTQKIMQTLTALSTTSPRYCCAQQRMNIAYCSYEWDSLLHVCFLQYAGRALHCGRKVTFSEWASFSCRICKRRDPLGESEFEWSKYSSVPRVVARKCLAPSSWGHDLSSRLMNTPHTHTPGSLQIFINVLCRGPIMARFLTSWLQ